MSETADTTSSSSPRRRKIQALLAGGTVLGVGALVTLAAWTDDEFAVGDFSASYFNLESSPESADGPYGDYESETAAAELTFEATNMVPEQTVYAPLWVRLDDETTVDGSIQADGGISIASDTTTGLNSDNLSFEVYHDVAACDDTAIDTGTLIASGGTLNTVETNPEAIDLTANEAGVDGDEELLCFAVTAADENEFIESEGAATTWQIQATSDEEG